MRCKPSSVAWSVCTLFLMLSHYSSLPQSFSYFLYRQISTRNLQSFPSQVQLPECRGAESGNLVLRDSFSTVGNFSGHFQLWDHNSAFAQTLGSRDVSGEREKREENVLCNSFKRRLGFSLLFGIALVQF